MKSNSAHLVVLIGRHRDEGCLGEDVSAEGGVFGAEAVIFIGFHDVDPRLILVHRIENDLEGRKTEYSVKRSGARYGKIIFKM